MKLILTILTILVLTISVKGQCVPGEISMPMTFDVIDTAHGWNYYHADGRLLWRNEPSYNIGLIPAGGYVTYGELFKQPYKIKGFLISYVKPDCSMDSVLRRTDVNGKDIAIKGRIISPHSTLRRL